MPLVTADIVKETTASTGTADYTVSGAVAGFRRFRDVCTTNDTVYYVADDGGSNREVGLGTYSATDTIQRTRIIASTNGGSAVNWAAGSKTIALTAPAEQVARTIRRSEWTGTYAYCGTGPEGAAESAAVWDITRLAISAAGAVTATARATGVAWNDRATASYS